MMTKTGIQIKVVVDFLGFFKFQKIVITLTPQKKRDKNREAL
jgi:hypothetical protein